jgi:hypothetical protein
MNAPNLTTQASAIHRDILLLCVSSVFSASLRYLFLSFAIQHVLRLSSAENPAA